MDAATLKVAKNYTNEKLNSLPSNRPTKTVSFDGGIYSVGNDVVNGQVSASLKGMTYTNLLGDGGDFEDNNILTSGVNNFAFVYSTDRVFGAKSIRLTPVSNPNTRSAGVNLVQGRYYLLSVYHKNEAENGEETHLAYRDATPVWIYPSTNTIRLSRTTLTFRRQGVKFQAISSDGYVGVSRGGTVPLANIFLDGMMLNEITADDYNNLTVDQLMQKYPYINNTKSTISASRLKSVGKNLFDIKKVERYGSKQGTFIITDSSITMNRIDSGYYEGFSCKLKTEIGKTYTISANAVNISDLNNLLFSINGISNFTEKVLSPIKHTFTTTSAETTLYVRVNAINKPLITLTNIQIEEGTTATEYEPYTESTQYLPNVGELRSLPNGVKDELSIGQNGAIKTQRVGTKVNVASSTVIDYADMATAGQFVAYYADGTQQVGVKGDTLTALAVSLTYQLAEPIITKLPAQAPLQVFENGTVYVEPIGDPSETTLPSVEMTIPTGNSNKFGVASHDYDVAAADWVLTNSESKCFLLAVSNAGGSANIIAPDRPGTMYAISNASGHTITIKISGGDGVDVNTGKKVLVIHDGTDYVALTAEL